MDFYSRKREKLRKAIEAAVAEALYNDGLTEFEIFIDVHCGTEEAAIFRRLQDERFGMDYFIEK